MYRSSIDGLELVLSLCIHLTNMHIDHHNLDETDYQLHQYEDALPAITIQEERVTERARQAVVRSNRARLNGASIPLDMP